MVQGVHGFQETGGSCLLYAERSTTEVQVSVVLHSMYSFKSIRYQIGSPHSGRWREREREREENSCLF